MKIEILNIFICSDKGKPMIPLHYVQAITGIGLARDHHALKGKLYSDHVSKRQITFISIEDIEEANKMLDVPFLPEETRRNILTRGIDYNSLVGKHFRIGQLIFEGTGLCNPCSFPSTLAGKPDFERAYKGRGGLTAKVIAGGLMSVGKSQFEVIS